MALDPKHVGKQYGPFTYHLDLEKMREFAHVVAGGRPVLGFGQPPPELSPLLHDEAAARQGPYGQVIAFPTFAVTFTIAAFSAAVTDPELGINLLMLVHGEQDFEFFDVMRAGDTMTTVGTIRELYQKAGKDFLVLVTESKNQHDKLVVRGTWTAVIRQG